jgi:hypothetical protein
MIENECALDGIKLLSLSRSKNKENFQIVDAVCREVVVGKLLKTKLPAPPSPPPPPPIVVPTLIPTVENRESVPFCQAASATTPFLAVVQYNCLEDDAQLIYGLIQSVIQKDLPSDGNEMQAITEAGTENEKNAVPTGKFVESNQLTKLQELSQFRKQLMATLPMPERAKDEIEDDLLLASLDSMVSAKQGLRSGPGPGQGQRSRGVPVRRPVR